MNDEKNKIDQNLNEESLVRDLKDLLDATIEDVSNTMNQLIENIETNSQDKEIHDETKKILQNFSDDLTRSLEPTKSKLIDNKIKRDNSKEEE